MWNAFEDNHIDGQNSLAKKKKIRPSFLKCFNLPVNYLLGDFKK